MLEKFVFNDLNLTLPDDYKINDFKKVEKILKNLKVRIIH